MGPDLFANIELRNTYQTENNFVSNIRNFSGLNVLSLNIQSLSSKFEELKILLDRIEKSGGNVSVLVLQEIWDVSLPNLFLIKDFELFTNTRETSKGGGVAIYCKKDLNPKLIPGLVRQNTFTFESIAIEIQLENVSVLIGSYYRSNKFFSINNSSNHFEPFFNELLSFLEICNNRNCKSYIFSDTNIDLLKQNNDVVSEYTMHILSSGFFPLNFAASRFVNKQSFALLDHIITNDNPKDTNIFQNIQSISDHNTIFLPIILDLKHNENSIENLKRNMNDNNIKSFKTALEKEKWINVFLSKTAEMAAIEFNQIFFMNFEKHFPLQKNKNKNARKVPLNQFMTKELLSLRTQKLSLYTIFQQTKRPEDKIKFSVCRNMYNRKIRQAKKVYFSKLIGCQKRNPKKMWETLKNITGMGNKPNQSSIKIDSIKKENLIISDQVLIANEFNKYFSSIGQSKAEAIPKIDKDFSEFLPPPSMHSFAYFPTDPVEIMEELERLENKTSEDINGVSGKLLKNISTEIAPALSYIYNLSLETGVFPNCWKMSRTIPIYKKDKKDDLSNFRPIGLINGFSKILEKILHKRLLSFLNNNNFFKTNQFGFLPGRNVMQAITKLLNYIFSALNNNESVLLVMLDISKAYDCIDYKILLKKLENAGIRGNTLQWFESYLRGRGQKVDINGTFSDLFEILEMGLVQGSSLSCLLFIIYVNDFFQSNKLFSVAFADDTNVASKCKNLKTLADTINKELEKITCWYMSNKLTINFEKTNAILFSNSLNAQNDCPDVFFKLGETTRKIERIKETDSVRFLGIWLDTKLNFNDYFKKIYRRLTVSLYAMKKIKNFLSFETMKLLYYSFFHSHLEFSSTFLMLTSNKNIDKIESLQKKAIRLLMGLPRISHTAEAFWALNILPFRKLGIFNVIKFLFQFKRDQLPPTFKKDFMLSKNIKNANLRNRNDFYIPRVKSIKIGLLPPHNFSKIWYENKRHFSKLSNINLISNFKQNLIEDFYQQNKCSNSNTCYVCKRIEESKDDFTKKKLKRLKRVKDIIKHKGCQKSARIKKMLKNARFA